MEPTMRQPANDDGKEPLTDRQKAVLDFISRSIEKRGYPPTLREIGEHFGIRSTNGVSDHLKALEKKGALTREDLKSRAMRPLGTAAATTRDVRDVRGIRPPAAPDFLRGLGEDQIRIPIIGRVAAGQPILAEEHVEDTVQVDSFFLGTTKKVYGLRVQGDSMIGDGILSGDYIFVKKQLHAEDGDIVVALIDDEATVKRVYFEGDRVRFQPSNPRMAPIYVRREDFRSTMLLGVVVGVYRKMA
jgi:repressor LexA